MREDTLACCCEAHGEDDQSEESEPSDKDAGDHTAKLAAAAAVVAAVEAESLSRTEKGCGGGEGSVQAKGATGAEAVAEVDSEGAQTQGEGAMVEEEEEEVKTGWSVDAETVVTALAESEREKNDEPCLWEEWAKEKAAAGTEESSDREGKESREKCAAGALSGEESCRGTVDVAEREDGKDETVDDETDDDAVACGEAMRKVCASLWADDGGGGAAGGREEEARLSEAVSLTASSALSAAVAKLREEDATGRKLSSSAFLPNGCLALERAASDACNSGNGMEDCCQEI